MYRHVPLMLSLYRPVPPNITLCWPYPVCRKEFEVALYHYEAAVKHADEDLAQVVGGGRAERVFLRPGPGAGKGGRAGVESWKGIHRAIGPAAQLRSQSVPSPLLTLPLFEPSPPPPTQLPDALFNLSVLTLLTLQPGDDHAAALSRATRHYRRCAVQGRRVMHLQCVLA